MRTLAMPRRMHSRTMRRTAMIPPCPVSPSMMTGIETLSAIQPARPGIHKHGPLKMDSGLAAAPRPGMTTGKIKRGIGPLGGDEAVDLAIAEQPAAALLDHLIVIGAAGADLRAFRAVLHDGPIRADIGG